MRARHELAIKYVDFILRRVIPIFLWPLNILGLKTEWEPNTPDEVLDANGESFKPTDTTLEHRINSQSKISGRPFLMLCVNCRLTIGALARLGNPDDGFTMAFAVPNYCPCCGEASNLSPEAMLAYQQLPSVED